MWKIFISPSCFLQLYPGIAILVIFIIPVSLFLSSASQALVPLKGFIARAIYYFWVYTLLCISLLLLKLSPIHATSLSKNVQWPLQCLLNRVWYSSLSLVFSWRLLTNTALLTNWTPCVTYSLCLHDLLTVSLLKCPSKSKVSMCPNLAHSLGLRFLSPSLPLICGHFPLTMCSWQFV